MADSLAGGRDAFTVINMKLGPVLRSAVGIDECMLVASLVLVTVGLWPTLGLGALVVPGVVGLWLAMPARCRFIRRDEHDDNARPTRNAQKFQ